MQEKTDTIATISARVGLNMHKGKTKILKVNTADQPAITLGGEALQEVDSFCYLGSIINKEGGTDEDVKTRIGKARAAFLQLKKVWSSSGLTIHTKTRIFNTIVKPVLLYGSETWRTTVNTMKRIQTS